jgi:Uri superfamily endonuclease
MLVIELVHPVSLQFGRRRSAQLQPGLYGYVGSALGPGGDHAAVTHLIAAPERCPWRLVAVAVR